MGFKNQISSIELQTTVYLAGLLSYNPPSRTDIVLKPTGPAVNLLLY
jgi:hypothetical protein